jgi:hypothetical protein
MVSQSFKTGGLRLADIETKTSSIGDESVVSKINHAHGKSLANIEPITCLIWDKPVDSQTNKPVVRDKKTLKPLPS